MVNPGDYIRVTNSNSCWFGEIGLVTQAETDMVHFIRDDKVVLATYCDFVEVLTDPVEIAAVRLVHGI